MSYPRLIRAFNVFVDGFGYLGVAQKADLPQPKIATESYRGSGMEMPVANDMGLEAMTAKVTMGEYVPRLFDLLGKRITMTLRPGERALEDGASRPFVFTMDGLITAPGFDALEQGKASMMHLTMEIDRLRVFVDGAAKWDLSNRPGAPRIVNGVDQLADLRASMGI
jgi:P2 family phage contractile tail tube protein